MFLIAGLGNPGKEYENTRHNIGFKFIDYIVSENNFYGSTNFKGISYQGEVHNKKAIFLKPQTYMNLSGESILSCCSFYKIPKERVIIIHDDIDLDFGEIKTKIGGGNAGHNGLKSIDSLIGKDYHRIRIGIGRPEIKEMVSNYVLSQFTVEEKIKISYIIRLSVEKLILLLT